MATYIELFALSQDAVLVQKLTTAVAVECEAIRTEPTSTPYHDTRVAWAKLALSNPDGMARKLLLCALAQNKDATVEVIQGADDAVLQSAVASAIPLLM